MKRLSISKEYFIYSIDGKTFFNTSKLRAALVVAGMLDLLAAEAVEINKKKLEIAAVLPGQLYYLEPIYEYIEEKPRKMEKVVKHFCMALTDKRIKELINLVGGALVELDRAEAGQKGLFKKNIYIPDLEYKEELLQVLKNNTLGEGVIGETDIALICLLEASAILKQYFDKDERKILKKKMKAVKNNPENKKIKKMVTCAERAAAACAACVASTSV